jgi:hypothetical protein
MKNINKNLDKKRKQELLNIIIKVESEKLNNSDLEINTKKINILQDNITFDKDIFNKIDFIKVNNQISIYKIYIYTDYNKTIDINNKNNYFQK